MRTAWRLRAIVSQADQCTAANTVLATHLRRWSTHVTVLPMTLDETVWQPRRVKSREAAVRVGWAGHPVNFPYLQAIAPALAAARESCPNVQFVIYSGSKPNLPGVEYEYLPFAPEKERDAIGSFDIGLLPLPTGNAFAAGKSPIKGLQYMACGIPTIATPLGATEAMFEEGATALFAQTIADWTRHITDLAANAERSQKMGHSARGVFEAGYSLGANLQRYADLLRKSED
jgi:glycosyltransferase involved in cell wall biosynthesis